MEIIVDTREPEYIFKKLETLGVSVTKEQLNIGDYIIGPDYIVERKTKSDFEQSIYDNRLFDQTQRMINEFENVIIIYESDNSANELSKNLAGAFAYLIVKKGIPIIPSTNHDSTAVLLERMASWIQEQHTDPVLNRGGPKRLTKKDQQLYLLQGLLGVGLKTANRLLDQFHTPNDVIKAINATSITYTRTGNPKSIEGPLTELSGIGIKFVQRNQELLGEND